jgi:hypothetical protein
MFLVAINAGLNRSTCPLSFDIIFFGQGYNFFSFAKVFEMVFYKNMLA